LKSSCQNERNSVGYADGHNDVDDPAEALQGKYTEEENED